MAKKDSTFYLIIAAITIGWWGTTVIRILEVIRRTALITS
jgi:hypothetical protein